MAFLAENTYFFREINCHEWDVSFEQGQVIYDQNVITILRNCSCKLKFFSLLFEFTFKVFVSSLHIYKNLDNTKRNIHLFYICRIYTIYNYLLTSSRPSSSIKIWWSSGFVRCHVHYSGRTKDTATKVRKKNILNIVYEQSSDTKVAYCIMRNIWKMFVKRSYNFISANIWNPEKETLVSDWHCHFLLKIFLKYYFSLKIVMSRFLGVFKLGNLDSSGKNGTVGRYAILAHFRPGI